MPPKAVRLLARCSAAVRISDNESATTDSHVRATCPPLSSEPPEVRPDLPATYRRLKTEPPDRLAESSERVPSLLASE